MLLLVLVGQRTKAAPVLRALRKSVNRFREKNRRRFERTPDESRRRRRRLTVRFRHDCRHRNPPGPPPDRVEPGRVRK